jgi:hypothetical protein
MAPKYEKSWLTTYTQFAAWSCAEGTVVSYGIVPFDIIRNSILLCSTYSLQTLLHKNKIENQIEGTALTTLNNSGSSLKYSSASFPLTKNKNKMA